MQRPQAAAAPGGTAMHAASTLTVASVIQALPQASFATRLRAALYKWGQACGRGDPSSARMVELLPRYGRLLSLLEQQYSSGELSAGTVENRLSALRTFLESREQDFESYVDYPAMLNSLKAANQRYFQLRKQAVAAQIFAQRNATGTLHPTQSTGAAAAPLGRFAAAPSAAPDAAAAAAGAARTGTNTAPAPAGPAAALPRVTFAQLLQQLGGSDAGGLSVLQGLAQNIPGTTADSQVAPVLLLYTAPDLLDSCRQAARAGSVTDRQQVISTYHGLLQLLLRPELDAVLGPAVRQQRLEAVCRLYMELQASCQADNMAQAEQQQQQQQELSTGVGYPAGQPGAAAPSGANSRDAPSQQWQQGPQTVAPAAAAVVAAAGQAPPGVTNSLKPAGGVETTRPDGLVQAAAAQETAAAGGQAPTAASQQDASGQHQQSCSSGRGGSVAGSAGGVETVTEGLQGGALAMDESEPGPEQLQLQPLGTVVSLAAAAGCSGAVGGALPGIGDPAAASGGAADDAAAAAAAAECGPAGSAAGPNMSMAALLQQLQSSSAAAAQASALKDCIRQLLESAVVYFTGLSLSAIPAALLVTNHIAAVEDRVQQCLVKAAAVQQQGRGQAGPVAADCGAALQAVDGVLQLAEAPALLQLLGEQQLQELKDGLLKCQQQLSSWVSYLSA